MSEPRPASRSAERPLDLQRGLVPGGRSGRRSLAAWPASIGLHAAAVVHSIPPLDAAALVAVRQWVFAPARKGGRPVESYASAPVKFSIY